MTILIRAILALLKNWRAILALAGLILATGFSGKMFVQELHESIFSHWFLLALVCVVILVREFLRGYFEIKRTETLVGMGRNRTNGES